ncbi:MAG: hypothetical protein V1911_01105 [Candidatus Micrarchaeota archaeon]
MGILSRLRKKKTSEKPKSAAKPAARKKIKIKKKIFKKTKKAMAVKKKIKKLKARKAGKKLPEKQAAVGRDKVRRINTKNIRAKLILEAPKEAKIKPAVHSLAKMPDRVEKGGVHCPKCQAKLKLSQGASDGDTMECRYCRANLELIRKQKHFDVRLIEDEKEEEELEYEWEGFD